MKTQTLVLISLGALALLAVIAYSTYTVVKALPREYAGHLSMGFETSAFTPCAPGERWWVSGLGAELSERYRAASKGQDYQPVFLRVRGRLSGTGRYGHLGGYERELEVLEILELRAAQDGDCARAPGT